ncbi:MAG: DNA mismatch repair protein MutS [Spirochaetales bacterium]
MAASTPMMEQYSRLKREHRDAVLFFRLGDFYEMFREDAIRASRILGLTLTKRQEIPMCGVPYHAAQAYIARLIKAGEKVAICEQTRLPESGKGIAERAVVEVVTPGTATEEAYLDSHANNYLVSVAGVKEHVVLAYVDVSTGEFGLADARGNEGATMLRRELARLQPREVLVQESLLEQSPISRALAERASILLNRYPDWHYDVASSRARLRELLGVENLKSFGVGDDSPLPLAAGVLIDYLHETARTVLPHVREIHVVSAEEAVGLDESTIRNLELIANLHDGGREYSLLSTIDFTQTAMGSRKLRSWVLSPLRSKERILERQRQVETLFRRQRLLDRLRLSLSRTLDLERLAGRVAMDRAHAKDLVAIRSSLFEAREIERMLVADSVAGVVFSVTMNKLDATVSELVDLLSSALLDEPSVALTEGNLIREGYDPELDRLAELLANSRGVLERYVEQERSNAGMTAIRIRHNKILGHFLEVTKSHAERVPDHFVRRQTLTNVERFTTEQLTALEAELSEASERIVEREREIFLLVRDSVKGQLAVLLELAHAMAELDVLQSLAHAATVRGYTAPTVQDHGRLEIVSGRHPVVEAHLPPGGFVPNGVTLDHDGDFLGLITGPNMAGKSTFLRQTALIVLLAQIGSFVPADEAIIGIVDRIFCRVGASDNLARGESTFLTEMNEAAFILRTATNKSLVIMDEIGRGTSTNDGRAIAQAVLEYLTHHVRPRTLFATHFHELTAVEAAGLKNLSLSIEENDGRIVFLKRVQDGPSSHSYGIHVARLAGVPTQVIDRASAILEAILQTKDAPIVVPKASFSSDRQSGLFDPGELILSELGTIDVNEMKPVEAIARIARWQEELRSTGR